MAKRVVLGRITKVCEVCGKSVTRKASEFREHVFCSRDCYQRSDHHSESVTKANAKRWPVDSVIEKVCEQCGLVVRRGRSQYRNRTFCSIQCRQENRATDAIRQVTAGGYIKVFVGRHRPGATQAGHILEHRKVMQEVLGRALLPQENVHHINGVRDDNRVGNLELWSKSQPCGQRVEEKLAWAHEFIALYEGLSME